jgi:hypothetical protein
LIGKICDIDGNGNCGFHAVAVSLGCEEAEWANIQREMAWEIVNQPVYHEEKYLDFLANGISHKKFLSKLKFFKSPAPLHTWITFPRHGFLLADTFQRPVIHISHHMTVTYLPILHPPTTNPPILLILLDEVRH